MNVRARTSGERSGAEVHVDLGSFGITMKQAFFLKYAVDCFRKDRLRKLIVTAACALAVAFTAMSAGFLGKYSAMQKEYMKNISERELIVYNNVAVENLYAHENLPISADMAEKIAGLDGVESVVPMVSFYAQPVNTFTALFALDAETKEYADEVIRQRFSTVTWNSGSGKQKSREFRVAEGDNYFTVSYPSAALMDKKALYLDESVENGGYITESFMERLGITEEEVKGLTLTAEVWVSLLQRGERFKMIDYFEDGSEEVSYDTLYFPWEQKTSVTARIRGVVPNTELPQEGDLFLPAEQMLEVVENLPLEKENFDRFNAWVEENKNDPNAEIPPYFDWAPNAYYVTAESVEDIVPLKEAISGLDPNFEVIYFYQNYQAGIQSLSNHRNVMVYISLAVLAVVFLLTALVYVSLIDKRKYEFAVLRANGLTKREVRRVVYAEMALQFALIFVVGLLFAALIYFIGGRWLGYPFQFDGLTVLWLFLISLGAVVLPTVISLLFVNRFEPDQVMRN